MDKLADQGEVFNVSNKSDEDLDDMRSERSSFLHSSSDVYISNDLSPKHESVVRASPTFALLGWRSLIGQTLNDDPAFSIHKR